MLKHTEYFEQSAMINKLIDMKLLDHNVHTPFDLCDEIFKRLGILSNKSILVLYSYEMVYLLIRQYNCNPSDIYLLSEPNNIKKVLAEKVGFNILSYSDINELKDQLNMKFDVIVGNPPFQANKKNGKRKDQASNLWSKFWVKSLELTTDKGKVALVTPTTWCSPSQDLKGNDCYKGMDRLWDIFNSYTSYANITDVSEYFPDVGSSFGYVVVDKSGKAGLQFSNGLDVKIGFLPKSNVDIVIKELDSTANLEAKFKINQNNSPDLRVSIPMTRKLSPEHIEILNGIDKPKTGSDEEGLYLYVHVNNQIEAEKVQQRIIDCLDIINNYCKWSGFINIKTVKMIKYQ